MTEINENVCNCLTLGDDAPLFSATTTHGEIDFSEYIKDSWCILFSHPADFTPVCTTEIIGFAQQYAEFEKKGVKLMGLSIDSVYSHIAWVRQIEKEFNLKIKFPIIADLGFKVANLYGMIQKKLSKVHTARTVFIIDNNGKIRMTMFYPSTLGRNIEEILRIIDSLQMSDREHVATPANWVLGESVIVAPPTTTEDAEKRTHDKHSECSDWYLCKKKI